MPSPSHDFRIVSTLIEGGRIAQAIYLLGPMVRQEFDNSPEANFLMGIALSNTRVDVYRLASHNPPDVSCLKRIDPASVNINDPIFVDPDMLLFAYQHFRKAFALGLNFEAIGYTHAIQLQTSELLLAFFKAIQTDPHSRAFKLPNTSLRVIQVGYLCLIQLSPQFVPSKYDGIKDYEAFIQWARDYRGDDNPEVHVNVN